MMLAVPAGVLSSGLLPLGQSLALVWMVGAAAWAVVVYGKRARQESGRGWLTIRAGARIGLVTGVFASWLTLGVNGIDLWVTRFVLHQGGHMDANWLTEVGKRVEVAQQLLMQMGMGKADAAEVIQTYRASMISPEGCAVSTLTSSIEAAAFLILFAAVGGALGARLLAQPHRTGT